MRGGAPRGMRTGTSRSPERSACATTCDSCPNTGNCTAVDARPIGSKAGRFAPDSVRDDGCGRASSAGGADAFRCGGRPLPARSTSAPRGPPPDPTSASPKFRPGSARTATRTRRKTNNPRSCRGGARRGGRAAKGGRLKICSRRSSQVRILAPAVPEILRRRAVVSVPSRSNPAGASRVVRDSRRAIHRDESGPLRGRCDDAVELCGAESRRPASIFPFARSPVED
jgi:hypothetical protein